MRLSNTDLARLIPVFMQDDNTAKAFISALNTQFRKVAAGVELIRLYSNLDYLDEHVLDELAWQFNITEYRNTYSVTQKRRLIRNCLSIHHKRGTVAAVKDVVENIFGDSIVEEWFEYGGDPYHFRVRTTNASSTDEMISELTSLIKDTQNVRSHLDSVTIELDNTMSLYTGIKAVIIDDEYMTVDTSEVGLPDPDAYLAICGSPTAICGQVYCGT